VRILNLPKGLHLGGAFWPGSTVTSISTSDAPSSTLSRPAPLRRLADRLNDTPRRCLGYRTPREVFQEHLAVPTGPP